MIVPMTNLEDAQVINIDFVEGLSLDDIGHIGPVARAFALQNAAAAAQRRHEYLVERLAREIDDQERQAASAGHIGSLTPAHERIARNPDVIAAKAEADAAGALAAAAQQEIDGVAFCVADDKLERATKKIAALSRKAVKIDCEPITLTPTDETILLNYCYEQDKDRGYHATFQHTFVILKGSTPRIPGFEFLGTITTTEAGNVIKTIPAIRFGIRHNLDFGHTHSEERHSAAAEALDAIDLSRFYTTGDICEHCNKRRGRTDTFIVYNEKTGETMQVGRQCLRAYMGTDDPMRIVKVLQQVWEELRNLSGKGETPPILTMEYLTHCAAMIRIEGGYRRSGDPSSTKGGAFTNIYNKREQRKNQKTGAPLWVDPTDSDVAYSRTIRNWVINEWTETRGDFVHNVKVAVTPEVLNQKVAGFAAAAFVAFVNAQAKAAKVKVEEEAKVPSDFIGTVDKRETFTLTVVDIKWMPGDYRQMALITFADSDGNTIKWFASDLPAVPREDADDHNSIIIGGIYNVKATVKKHENHTRYGKSTMISRCKIEAIVSEPVIEEKS